MRRKCTHDGINMCSQLIESNHYWLQIGAIFVKFLEFFASHFERNSSTKIKWDKNKVISNMNQFYFHIVLIWLFIDVNLAITCFSIMWLLFNSFYMFKFPVKVGMTSGLSDMTTAQLRKTKMPTSSLLYLKHKQLVSLCSDGDAVMLLGK